MSKHTPGPYEREGDTVYALTTCTTGSFRGTPCNRWAAQVQRQNGVDGASPEEREAVAALFQSSPDLLASLKALESHLRIWLDKQPYEGGAYRLIGNDINRAAEIIRKAEGKE